MQSQKDSISNPGNQQDTMPFQQIQIVVYASLFYSTVKNNHYFHAGSGLVINYTTSISKFHYHFMRSKPSKLFLQHAFPTPKTNK